MTTQGGRNIVVSIPGTPDAATLDAIRKPSQLRFRAVLAADAGSPQSAATGTGTATGTETDRYRHPDVHRHDPASRLHAGHARHRRGDLGEPGDPAGAARRPDARADRRRHGHRDARRRDHPTDAERPGLGDPRDPRRVHRPRLLQARVGQRRRRRPGQAAGHLLGGQAGEVHPRPGRGRRHRHRRRVGRLPDVPERPADQRRRGPAEVHRRRREEVRRRHHPADRPAGRRGTSSPSSSTSRSSRRRPRRPRSPTARPASPATSPSSPPAPSRTS